MADNDLTLPSPVPTPLAAPAPVPDRSGLYSHAAFTAQNLPQEKGTPEQFAAMLTKAGVKKEEMERSGFLQAMAGRKSITKNEVMQHFQEAKPRIVENVKIQKSDYDDNNEEDDESDLNSDGGSTRYNEYTMPGGSDYKELLMKIPVPRKFSVLKYNPETGRDDKIATYNSSYMAVAHRDALNAQSKIAQHHVREYMPDDKDIYKHAHWPGELNVIGHIRMKTRNETPGGPQMSDEEGNAYLASKGATLDTVGSGMRSAAIRDLSRMDQIRFDNWLATKKSWVADAIAQKILHIEELQSDWHQAGRKYGYKGVDPEPKEPENMPQSERNKLSILQMMQDDGKELSNDEMNEFNSLSNRWRKLRKAQDRYREKKAKMPPDAPFKGDAWKELLVKRALVEAARGGHDKIVWTPGDIQTDRYDLSHQIGEIHLDQDHDGEYSLNAKNHDGRTVVDKNLDDLDELDELLGKDVAEKLKNADEQDLKGSNWVKSRRSLVGQDVKVGGKGMREFYDKIVPATFNKIVKKLDPEVGVERYQIHPYRGEGASGDEVMEAAGIDPDIRSEYWRNLPQEERNRMLEEHRNRPVSVQGIKMTPKLRAAILRGLPTYADGGAVTHGEPIFEEAPVVSQDRPLESHPQWIPTRLPALEKNRKPGQIVDLAALKETPGDFFPKIMGHVRDYVNTPSRHSNLDDHQLAEEYIEHMKRNLLDLHDRVQPHIRQRSQLWYDGARAITDRWSKQYNLPDHSVAGALAALSPQMDWFKNVSLAHRVIDTMVNKHDLPATPEMSKKFADLVSLNSKPKYQKIADFIAGKSLSDIDRAGFPDKERVVMKALWLRLHDETHNPRTHNIITPEGDEGDIVRTGKGKKAGTGWGSFNEIGKAIQAIEAANAPEKISQLMGEKHKVRNFYNNILSPYSAHGDITADTHAVAAALYRPLSGKSVEVAHNLGTSAGKGVKAAPNSAISGIAGTYPLTAEAYRRAAKERGILPRQMQSITWEAIRGMFPSTFKNAKNNAMINGIWNDFKHGRITEDQARERVRDHALGQGHQIPHPDWHIPGSEGGASGPDEAIRDTPYAGGLPSSGAPRQPAQRVDAGRSGKRTRQAEAPSPLMESRGGPVVNKALDILSRYSVLRHG